MDKKQKRKLITDKAIALMKDLLPNSNNMEITRERLDRLSDKEFEELMMKFKNGEDYLQLFTTPGDDNSRLNMDRIHDVADKWKVKLYYRVWKKDKGSGWELSTHHYPVLLLPVRIQQQLISKSVRIPKDNKHIDYFTGQATSKMSKGARVSYPELHNYLASGLMKTAEEMLHFRGGSKKGMQLLENSIVQTGGASIDALKPYTGEVGATTMLHHYLTAMQLKSTLREKS